MNKKYDEESQKLVAELAAMLYRDQLPKIEKHGFVPYKKGDYVYTAEINDGFERITVDVRRDEVVGTWHTKQTRCIHLGELVVVDFYGEERKVEIRNAYHSLNTLLDSMAHMFSRSLLQYIYISIKSNPAFEKIGTFRLCVEIDPHTGE